MLRYSFWWLLPDSNWGHAALQAAALPTELKSLKKTNLRFFSSRRQNGIHFVGLLFSLNSANA